jgi:acylphosphatase
MTETGAIVRRVLVGGAVQGVGCREFTRRATLRLGVAGWVRNRSDARGEPLVCGPREALEALVAEMRKGPPSAMTDLDYIQYCKGAAFAIQPTE